MWTLLRRKQSGQIAIATPFALLAMISFIALVVDVGLFNLIRSELQNAADAGALASVWYRPLCTANNSGTDPRCAADDWKAVNQAGAKATEFAMYNAGLAKVLCGSTPYVDPPQLHSLNRPRVWAITVIVHCNANYLAGRVLGLGSTDVWATATAAFGNSDGTGEMGDYVHPPTAIWDPTPCASTQPPQPPQPPPPATAYCPIGRLVP